ncbi:NADP-dependent oxidoreductase [Yersinia sp. J1]|uniref:NADP-dependent oxidoreductase n=1 Tax=Yersinia sp. J1 TaxID=3424774 RepID=UPI003D36A36B
MEAVMIDSFSDTPKLATLDKPTPAPGEILLRMVAASLNPIDWRIATGFLDGKKPHHFPLILGAEGSGIVEAVGEGVTKFLVGDAVIGNFLHHQIGHGSFAEYQVIQEDAMLLRVNNLIDLVQASALPIAAMTAWQAVNTLNLPSGSRVLLVGASGGVGTFTVQFAAQFGYKVIAVAATEATTLLHKLGACNVIDRHKSSVNTQVLLRYTNGIDGIIDLVNPPDAFAQLLPLLKPQGTAISTIGSASLKMSQHIRLVNLEMKPELSDLRLLMEKLANNTLQVVVDRTIGLEQVPAALEQIRQGGIRGKILIRY